MLWNIVWMIALLVFVAFVYVIAFGAPFLPTLRIRTKEALDLLDLQPGQTLLELGSGDGRILRAAAERGIYAIGYELNPLLVVWTKLRHWKYRKYIRVRCVNYWVVEWPVTDGIYVFLLDRYMKKLDTKITKSMTTWPKKHSLRLLSFAFAVPGKKPVKDQNGLMLYRY